MSCKRCKCELERGVYCIQCGTEVKNERMRKAVNMRIAKMKSTPWHAITLIKQVSKPEYWATAHKGCFRATFGKGESEVHMDKKYERWKYWRKLGADVFTELVWKNGGRSDLVISLDGDIFIEEIVCTEKDASIMSKMSKYPFPIKSVIRT